MLTSVPTRQDSTPTKLGVFNLNRISLVDRVPELVVTTKNDDGAISDAQRIEKLLSGFPPDLQKIN